MGVVKSLRVYVAIAGGATTNPERCSSLALYRYYA